MEEKNNQSFKYALVLIESLKLNAKTFSYSIPDDLVDKIQVGQAVLVPFGVQGVLNGFVAGLTNDIDDGIKTKNIIEILDETPLFNENYLKFLSWTAGYYFCDIKDVLSVAIPLKFLKQSKNVCKRLSENIPDNFSKEACKVFALISKKEIALKSIQKKSGLTYSKFYFVIRKLRDAGLIETKIILEKEKMTQKTDLKVEFLSFENASKRQTKILENLKEQGTCRLIDFEKENKTTRTTIKKLEALKCLKITEYFVDRNPLEIFNVNETEEAPCLSDEQKVIYQGIKKKMEGETSAPILLHGITASGKTEIYFKFIEDTIKRGKNVLFLLPEIALASEISRRIAKRFGIDSTAIWHSSISDGEKYDVWQKLRQNKIKILAGARSAVFAPIQNIGLIIVDEEHESSFKQSSPAPRYDARKMAKKLAQMNNAPLLLGSATPDINDYYEAVNSGNLFTLNTRFNNVPMAKVIAVDMKKERQNGNLGVLSRTLQGAIQKNLDEKKQTLILINRRGFSTNIQCLACGETIKCPNCSIPMVWHSDEQKIKCHYCGHEDIFPETCPECGSDVLKNMGLGIEKVETNFKKIFPDAKIQRLDSDVLSSKSAHIKILDDFHNGNIDILIGTQMVAKGLDNKNVTVVGVINADQSFNMPDFRSGERGFQLLTQVAGRAGRGEFGGKVYFQTMNPENYALKSAKCQDYKDFYEQEIAERKDFLYPPFVQIIRLVVSSENKNRAESAAKQIKDKLNSIIEQKSFEDKIVVQGGIPCLIEKIKNEYRYQILIKNLMGSKGHALIKYFTKQVIWPKDIRFIIDVDPIDIF